MKKKKIPAFTYILKNIVIFLGLGISQNETDFLKLDCCI